MLPIHFGDAERALFGIYHPPRRARARPLSAVLCNPMGHEYVGAYRTLKVLADALAGSGVSVLRFDYFGTGDSAGAADAGNVDEWLEDISTALDEVKDAAGTERTTLIGLRLGGALAAIAAQSRTDVDRVVLWEPVLSGREHVAGHLSRHADWLELGRCRTTDSTKEEALGFPLTRTQVATLSRLDLTELPAGTASQALLLFHSEERRARADCLRQTARHVETRVVTAPDFWLGRTAFDQPLVSKSNVQLVVEWVTQEAR